MKDEAKEASLYGMVKAMNERPANNGTSNSTTKTTSGTTSKVSSNKTSNNLGKPVYTRKQLEKLSTIDLVARTIYGEADFNKDDMDAVAWTIKNRKDSGDWGDFKGVVLAQLQFCGLTRNEDDSSKNPP